MAIPNQREFVKIATSSEVGCVIIKKAGRTQGKGSHIKLKSPDGKTGQVPYTKPGKSIATGTFYMLLRQLGIPKSAFEGK